MKSAIYRPNCACLLNFKPDRRRFRNLLQSNRSASVWLFLSDLDFSFMLMAATPHPALSQRERVNKKPIREVKYHIGEAK